jgi:hypothetical protein
MNVTRNRWMAAALGAFVMTGLGACVAEGGGGAAVVVGYDGGYYEPYGYDYGGWGHGYRVGPGRGGDPRGDPRGGHPPQSYRPAPASRPTPSIPSRSRGH